MTTPKHTPGPWQWWTSNSWRRLSSGTKDGNVLCPVVQRSDGHSDVIVSEADMALIEAAPCLLAACEAAARNFEAYESHPLGDQLRAAIAKARGAK